MASAGKDRGARAARERARLYQARQDFRARQLKRRSRDSIVAAVVGGVIVLAAVGAQIAYFTAGPGAPLPQEPTPTPTASAPATPAPTEGSTPATSTPSPSVTP